MSTELPELLDVQEAAAALHLSVPTLYRWAAQRRLRSFKISNRVFFSRTDLRALLDRCAIAAE